MSLTEHRSSPSTVQFTYSLQPRPSTTSLPSLTTLVDILASLLQSALFFLLGQWATIHLDTNQVFGPVLRYLRHLLPQKDIRILHNQDNLWELTPFGAVCIVSLAFFLFFSKSTPTGSPAIYSLISRRILLDDSLIGCTDYNAHAVSISKSFAIYTSF